MYLDEWAVRREISETGRRLYDLFLVAGNSGNISVRLNEREILMTPTHVSKGNIALEDILKIAPDGRVLESLHGTKPSSEYRMHLAVYRHRSNINAVVHAHPPTATGFAVAGRGFERPFHPEIVVSTGPIPVVPYVPPGGDELPESIVPYLSDHHALLLGNHGALTYAPTLRDALFAMEAVELNARIFMTAYQLGNVNYLDDQQVAFLIDRYTPAAAR